MELVIMYLVAIAAVGIVGFMLVKKMDIKISLFLIGIVLMYIALLMGKDISFTDFVSSGVTWLDPFKVVGDQFVSTLTSAGFIILILGGYTGYMSHIGANEVTVSVLAKPIAHIKSPYILVPITFLLGNLLSLVIPSASNLAIILMATLDRCLPGAGEEIPSVTRREDGATGIPAADCRRLPEGGYQASDSQCGQARHAGIQVPIRQGV